MRVLITLLKKEFKQIFRDKAIVALIFAMPAIQLLILPFAADSEIKNVNIGIIDQDHSSYSRQLVEKIEYSSYFTLTEYDHSYKKAMKWLEKDEADLFIEIPANFERKLIREQKSQIFLAVNAVNGVKGSLGAAYALNTIGDLNKDIVAEWITPPRNNMSPQIEITHSHWYNPLSNYQQFMVPGILAILLTMVGGFLSALNIVKEKEIGTIEQLNVTPITKTQFILGKLIPFWMLGFVVLTIGLLISYIIHGIVPGTNLGALYVFSAFYLVTILGFGLMISNFTETQQQAMMVAFFFMLIFILLSGLFTSLESMPVWAQKLAWINPVTYMVDVTRMVLLKGANLSDMTFHIIAIGAEGLFLNVMAIWTYRKRS
jgi:ABC-2 type transport system permease protein